MAYISSINRYKYLVAILDKKKTILRNTYITPSHDDVIKWKHFPRYWPFVREIHRWPVNFPHKGQWRGALMFTLICARMNGWVNNREAGDLRRYGVHYDVIVIAMKPTRGAFDITKTIHQTKTRSSYIMLISIRAFSGLVENMAIQVCFELTV